jgi:tetratricopeptide (TPR) repeat protein
MRMFNTATTLNPDWDLSWGHLIAIVLEVGKIARRGQAGLGFEPPEAEPVTPYERNRDTEEQLWYCPVVEADTIAWREVTIDGCPLDPAAREGASRLYSETVDRVFDWMTGIGLDRPRHHVQLADLLLEERESIGCEGDQVRADSLLDAAQAHFERALEMLADTTPQQRVSLANLYLARSDLDRALGQAERALAELPDWEQPGSGVPPPLAAANPFLAAGRPETAARIVARIWSENTASFPHPLDPDRTIRAQGQYARLLSLEGLGFAAEAGPEIAERLSRVLGAWRDAPIPDRDEAALRRATLDIVGPALVHAPELWEDWFADWDRYGLEPPPVWKGFVALSENPLNRTEAVARLEESIAALNARGADSDRVSAAEFYLPLLLARAVGATDTETDLLQRLSRCMLQLDMYDPVWGAFGSLGLIEK